MRPYSYLEQVLDKVSAVYLQQEEGACSAKLVYIPSTCRFLRDTGVFRYTGGVKRKLHGAVFVSPESLTIMSMAYVCMAVAERAGNGKGIVCRLYEAFIINNIIRHFNSQAGYLLNRRCRADKA